ncbi:hypothetical protein PCANC_13630 [Puccinia coronata f. sp. avenae]|uniref:Uncharacterized protein n=1 Tax=Puccinia coronata f. sp. avenae TaxID=200324 RepID=A0A2N5UKC8_9BASI|nr:hypothetical protein PCANC_22230 [Puccinia coronata f. sp. avenae]PLW38211.1 hypothetical protein PCANC_13630 [Puccinia coronata f. sp. avenae]
MKDALDGRGARTAVPDALDSAVHCLQDGLDPKKTGVILYYRQANPSFTVQSVRHQTQAGMMMNESPSICNFARLYPLISYAHQQTDQWSVRVAALTVPWPAPSAAQSIRIWTEDVSRYCNRRSSTPSMTQTQP